MGKYMRKGKGVEKMPVMEGVRTRARALALLLDSKNQCSTSNTNATKNAHRSSQCLVTSVVPTANEMHRLDNYMELRSRRLEKTPAKTSIMAAGERITRHSLLKNNITSCRTSDKESSMPERRTNQGENLCLDSSAISGATSMFLSRVTPTISTSNSICVSERQPPVSTRTRHQNQRQENASLASPERMDMNEAVIGGASMAAVQSNVDVTALSAEAEQSVGETVMSKSKKDRESTPESYSPGMETPGSTTRPRLISRDPRSVSCINCIPSSSEIEDFFQDAEKQEQNKFIERYNFDPASEKPLQGRYEWICL